ncbi:MAG: DNA-binding response regulator [Clostridiales bacterium]|nr:MAG: DNA-binding response regulator [Clostridiales bacterium]
MNKVLLVEDENDLRKIIANYLKQANFTVVEAADGEQALSLFADGEYDLVILDLMLPKVNGYEVCLDIRRSSKVPIVILTARDSEIDELRGFNCGADEYIAKPFSPNILIARIKSLLKRCDTFMENTVQIKDFSIDNRQRLVYYQGNRVITTPKEFELLYYLVNNRNIALSREQILDAVWGMDYYGDTRTVDTHIKCLRAKLGDFGQQIKTVRKVGYKLEV